MFLGWYDNDKNKSVQARIQEAADRYMEKFDAIPDICLVNEKDIIDGFDGIEIVVSNTVRPNHYWVGERANVPDFVNLFTPV